MLGLFDERHAVEQVKPANVRRLLRLQAMVRAVHVVDHRLMNDSD